MGRRASQLLHLPSISRRFYRVILPEEPYKFGTDHIKARSVPKSIQSPPYCDDSAASASYTLSEALSQNPDFDINGRIPLGGVAEQCLRNAASLAAQVRKYIPSLIKVGITTDEIDIAVHDFIVSHNAYPSPLHYRGYPKATCISVNNIIAHGIPDDHPLEDGDIVNVDITVFSEGFHGDTSATWQVGEVDEDGQLLCKVANECTEVGIRACGPGRRYDGIGAAIHEYLRGVEKTLGQSFCVSQQFDGHGIGLLFHKRPWIIHTKNTEPGVMTPGDCFTIEPAIIEGSDPEGWIFPDGWTASTTNCSRSAQFEHMVLITQSGAEVLTR